MQGAHPNPIPCLHIPIALLPSQILRYYLLSPLLSSFHIVPLCSTLKCKPISGRDSFRDLRRLSGTLCIHVCDSPLLTCGLLHLDFKDHFGRTGRTNKTATSFQKSSMNCRNNRKFYL